MKQFRFLIVLFFLVFSSLSIYCKFFQTINRTDEYKIYEKMTADLVADISLSQTDSANFVEKLNERYINFQQHGFAKYTFADNWVLYLFSKVTEDTHRGIVIPNHLIQCKIGICSQQAILWMDILQKYGFKTRAVRLNKHFVSEVFYNQQWHLFDSDFSFTDSSGQYPSTIDFFENKNEIQKVYYRSATNTKSNFFKSYELLPINDFPAKNLRLLHEATFLISDNLWLVCGMILLLIYRIKVKNLFVSRKIITEKL